MFFVLQKLKLHEEIMEYDTEFDMFMLYFSDYPKRAHLFSVGWDKNE